MKSELNIQRNMINFKYLKTTENDLIISWDYKQSYYIDKYVIKNLFYYKEKPIYGSKPIETDLPQNKKYKHNFKRRTHNGEHSKTDYVDGRKV